jgi:hypothetical protein
MNLRTRRPPPTKRAPAPSANSEAALLPLAPGALEQLNDFLIFYVEEVLIPEADGHEVGGRF